MNILITGGASGLGEAITRRLVSDTQNTVYFTFTRSSGKADAIMAEFPNAKGILCDFTDTSSVAALRDHMKTLDLDVLVNNAYTGDFLKTHFHKIPSAVFLDDFRNNVIPTIEITQEAITVFRKKKSGKIISILTGALDNVPPAGASVYVGNKSYLGQLSKVWASENARFGITSNTISPSFMLTSMTGETDERMIETIIESHPLKKLLTTAETADAVAFFATASPHINGIDILINAATTLR